jgi:hypothetical protein
MSILIHTKIRHHTDVLVGLAAPEPPVAAAPVPDAAAAAEGPGRRFSSDFFESIDCMSIDCSTGSTGNRITPPDECSVDSAAASAADAATTGFISLASDSDGH